MTKLIRTLIIINGILFPSLFLFLIGKSLLDNLNGSKTNYNNNGLIIGDALHEAKANDLALQGLEYDLPSSIFNSTGYYLPVSIMNYKEAKLLSEQASSANNISSHFFKFANVLFLDENMENPHWLLSKKASIREIVIKQKNYYLGEEESDTTYKHLLFEIGFQDTNKDGIINKEDHHDLYISNLNGRNLTQVSQGMDLIHYELNDNNSSIFLKYVTRNDSIRREHKLEKFAQYDIKSSKLIQLKELNQKLDSFQNNISE